MKSYNGIIMGFRNHGVSPSHYGSSILKWSNDLDVFGDHDLGNPQMMISWFSFFHFLFKHILWYVSIAFLRWTNYVDMPVFNDFLHWKWWFQGVSNTSMSHRLRRCFYVFLGDDGPHLETHHICLKEGWPAHLKEFLSDVPSSKHTKNDGTSYCLLGKSW
jgi:hypothetical protein